MKIYISGKVTGLPRAQAVAKFGWTKHKLFKLGFDESEIWNPMEHVATDAGWDEAMKICLAALEDSSAIVMQSDWEESPGASKELDVAIENGIFFYFEAMGDMEMIRKEVLENRFKIREWGKTKVLTLIAAFLMLFTSCNLYKQPETVELRYSIDVTHCRFQPGKSTYAVKVVKPTRAAMEFECKNCTLRYIVYPLGDYKGENTVISTTAETYRIDGKNSVKYNQY